MYLDFVSMMMRLTLKFSHSFITRIGKRKVKILR